MKRLIIIFYHWWINSMNREKAINLSLILILFLFAGRLASGWCSLAYWEQSNRVGDVTEVFKNTVNVVSDHSANDDVCLTSLAAGTPKLVANATRCKIGPGITISHEGDSMWLYNRSTQPVFVHSLTISDMDSILGHSAMIQKLWPGHCLRAYNPK